MAMDVPTLTLLFVFDAEGGLIDRLIHAWRKKTGKVQETCALSKLTRTALGTQPQWRQFLKRLPVPVRYLHREEFRGHHQSMNDVELPAVFICYEDGSLELAIDAPAIRRCQDSAQLERLVRSCVDSVSA